MKTRARYDIETGKLLTLRKRLPSVFDELYIIDLIYHSENDKLQASLPDDKRHNRLGNSGI